MRDVLWIIVVTVVVVCLLFSRKEHMTQLNNNDIYKIEKNITPKSIYPLKINNCAGCNIKFFNRKPYMGCSCTKRVYVKRGFSGANRNQDYVSKTFDTATDLSGCKVPYKFKYNHNGNNAPTIVCER